MRKPPFLMVLLSASLLTPPGAGAAWFGAEFSAEMSAYSPQTRQWERRSTIYVGKNAMRTDTQQGYQTLINVVDARSRTLYSINPQQQAYMQTPMPEGNVPMLTVVPLPGEPDSLCQTDGISCKKLGEEQVGGIQTQKWEISDERDPLVTIRRLQWLDPVRKMVLKTQEPGNTSTELKYLGDTTLGERKVEKWETTFKKGDQTQRSVSYVDPKLHVALRLEAGDQVLALSNIQEKPQPESLFQVPKNFRRVTPEEARRSTATSGMGQGQTAPTGAGPAVPGRLPGR